MITTNDQDVGATAAAPAHLPTIIEAAAITMENETGQRETMIVLPRSILLAEQS